MSASSKLVVGVFMFEIVLIHRCSVNDCSLSTIMISKTRFRMMLQIIFVFTPKSIAHLSMVVASAAPDYQN
jgi:hypothetical protein